MKLKSVHLLLLLSLCWGPSFLFIKIAVQELSPLMLAALRIGFGALILNVFLLTKGHYLPKSRRFWFDCFIAGLFAVSIPFLLINWGQQYVSSSLGSLLNGLTPIFTILFSLFILNNEKLSENKVKGIFLGFLGLGVLVYPDLSQGITANARGILAISLGAASYGIGWVYVRKRLVNIPSVKAPAAQLLIVSLYLVPSAFLLDSDFSIYQLSWETIGSVWALGLFGTALAFLINFKLIEQAGASYASMVTYLMPIVGVILGVTILDESLSLWFAAGASLILSGIYIGNKKINTKRSITTLDVGLYSKFR
jgi:drug/metabolite transporter (DMT)-like permease